MNNHEFTAKMRAGELFHSLRLKPDQWSILRVDGHGFSRFTEKLFQKPFDERFYRAMLQTAETLIEEFHGVYGYVQSDEISILLPPEWSLFDRSLEKTVSLSAGLASARFSTASGHVAYFDSRIWQGASKEEVIDYFRWRQSDAMRCAINGSCYWVLRQNGHDAGSATKALDSKNGVEKNALLAKHGIAFHELPAWQQNGAGLYRVPFRRSGYNPLTGEKREALRRQLKIESTLPTADDYTHFLNEILESYAGNNGPKSG